MTPIMPRQTVMRSVRISRELDGILRKEAERRGVSVNSLVSEIFTKYSEWDRFADRFGMVTFPRQGYRKMWELFNKDQVIDFGKYAGSRTASEVVQFWFKKLNTQTLLKLVALYAKYSKTYEYELGDTGGREYVITMHHEINERYSIFLANYFEEAVKAIVGVTPKIDIGINSVVITFKEPL